MAMAMYIGTLNLLELFSYLCLWTSLYFVLFHRRPTTSKEWHCRTVTIIHAIAISCLAFYCTFVLGPSPWSDAGGPNTAFQIHTCCLCLAYFLFDLSWCLYYETEGAVMLAHHILSIVGLSWCLVMGKYGTEMVATIGGAEVTNPLLQIRWFVKEMGHYNTLLGDAIDWAFMLSFGFMRIGMGSFLLYRYYLQPTDFWGRLGGSLIYIIGWLFFISIVRYAIHKHTKRYRAWKSKGKSQQGKSRSPPLSSSSSSPASYDLQEDRKEVEGDVSVIREKEIPTQREIKHRDGELALRKNCVVKESL